MSDSEIYSAEFDDWNTSFWRVYREQRKGIKVSGEKDTSFSQQQQNSRFPTYLFFSFDPTHSIQIVISAILLFAFNFCQQKLIILLKSWKFSAYPCGVGTLRLCILCMHETQHLEMYIITPGTPEGCSKTIKFIIVIVFYNDSKAQTLKDKLRVECLSFDYYIL